MYCPRGPIGFRKRNLRISEMSSKTKLKLETKYIANPKSRIAKLRNRNYEIETARSRNQNREIAESELRNREIAEPRNLNRGITESRNHGIAESRIGIGNRNRKHAKSARIGNRDLESGIANWKSEIESKTCHVRLGGRCRHRRRKLFSGRFDGMRSRL